MLLANNPADYAAPRHCIIPMSLKPRYLAHNQVLSLDSYNAYSRAVSCQTTKSVFPVSQDQHHHTHGKYYQHPKMRIPLALLSIALWVATARAQQATTCTSDLVVTDDCTDVMNPIACYNQYRWNARTLSCIEGANDTERKRKARLVQNPT